MQTLAKTALLAATATLLLTPVAPAAASGHGSANPYVLGQKCKAAKLKAAGKACLCRTKALAKSVAKGTAVDTGKCSSKLARSFNKADAKGQGWCPNENDSGVVEGRVAGFCSAVSSGLVGSSGLDKAARKCAGKKLKAAGKLCMCLHKAKSKAIAKGRAPDESRCRTKYAASFAKAEAKAEAKGGCATSGDATSVEAEIDGGFAEVEADVLSLGTDHFAARGSYGVGNISLDLVDSTRTTQASGPQAELPTRTLPTQVWYPADVPTYIDQRNDAALVDENKKYPLIIRSHGFGGTNIDSMDLTRHLASHGYIVVAPTFPLSNLNNPQTVRTILDVDEQARDVGFLIDTVVGWNNDPDNRFYGRVDLERIGATGHSLGGLTSMLASFHSEVRDPRIDVVVALAPLACVFEEEFYDSADTPLMIIAGTEDMITPVTSNATVPYERANATKYLMLIEDGTHIGFANLFLNDPDANGDEALFCAPLFPEGSERPGNFTTDIPDDYLGGVSTGIDTSASICEPICPVPPDSTINHNVQQELVQAGTLAFFEHIMATDVSARRTLQDRLADENESVSMSYEEDE